MPEISKFYGIRICMYVNDHLPPHIHADYGGEEAMISIMTGAIIKGSLPVRAHRLVSEWVELRRSELDENWARAHASQPLLKIAPL